MLFPIPFYTVAPILNKFSMMAENLSGDILMLEYKHGVGVQASLFPHYFFCDHRDSDNNGIGEIMTIME
jgi:hypothetical protein